MKFTYSSGQKPLAGYTLKRGIGKGGFGEVYFGVSDGGKEVALKLIRSNCEVELRGIGQCLNLKHPNLVHLYDLRTDGTGDYWLVMEYVEGESLATILARNPDGVAAELAITWLLGLADGIQHLHEHGIVHRDLKPGNIFLEKGTIKIGDYGLCKLMGSQYAGQTQSIGTVHYMAPEISTGNYNRQIDIYAAGVIFYEMLTGKVPFDGETAGEILMKHLTSPPDLSKVPSPFVPILDKALSKNPAKRFQSMGEMSQRLVAIAERPAPLSQPVLPVAQQLTTKEVIHPSQVPTTDGRQDKVDTRKPVTQLCGSLLYAVLLAGIMSLIWTTAFADGDLPTLARIFFVTALCSWAVRILGQRWTEPVDDSSTRRLVQLGLGLLIGLIALWLDGYRFPMPGRELSGPNPLETWAVPATEANARHPVYGALYPNNQTLPVLVCYLGYFGLMFLLLRWWKITEIRRPRSFNFQAVIAIGFWAYVLLFLLPGYAERQLGFVSLLLASIIVQLVSPWQAPAPVRNKRVRLHWA